jgi:hypothetical protein
VCVITWTNIACWFPMVNVPVSVPKGSDQALSDIGIS